MESPFSGVSLFVVGGEEGDLPVGIGRHDVGPVRRIGDLSDGSRKVHGLGQVDGLGVARNLPN